MKTDGFSPGLRWDRGLDCVIGQFWADTLTTRHLNFSSNRPKDKNGTGRITYRSS